MTLKKTLMAGAAGAAMFAIASPVATTADAAGSIKNGAKSDLKVYGQVGRGLIFFDDGEVADWRSADADQSSSRFGFKASAKMTESVTIEAVLEQEMESNSSGSSGWDQSSDADEGGSFTQRKAEISFKSKSFGRFTMGQTSVISDGMSDGLDLSGAAGAWVGMDPRLVVGGIKFRNENATKTLSTKSIRASFATFDAGRADAIQYETPNMNGLRLQAGVTSQGKEPGIGLLYDNKFGGVKVRVRGFWENQSGDGTTGNIFQLGGSVKHDSGISLTGMGGVRETDTANRSDAQFYAGRIGYTANMNSLGATGIGFTYHYTKDFEAEGDEGHGMGIGIMQDVKNAGARLFANVMVWDLDQTGTTELDSVVTMFVGGRLQF